MKAYQDETATFKPVHLVLETQEEVDKIFALLNNVKLITAIEFPHAYIPLRKYYTNSYNKWFYRVLDLMKS